MSSLAATSVLALFWIIGTIRNFPVQEGNTEYFLRTFFLGYIYVIAIVDELMQLLLCLQTRQSFTAKQVSEATYVDIHGNKAVFDSLRNNPKVLFDGTRFSYKVNAFDVILLAVSLNQHIHE